MDNRIHIGSFSTNPGLQCPSGIRVVSLSPLARAPLTEVQAALIHGSNLELRVYELDVARPIPLNLSLLEV